MSSSNTETQVEAPAEKVVVKKQKKLKPARKQVEPGTVDKETAPQTGKEYSPLSQSRQLACAHPTTDIWYNKWAGGDREDNYSKYVLLLVIASVGGYNHPLLAARQNLRRAATSRRMPA